MEQGNVFTGVCHSVHDGLPSHNAMGQADLPPPARRQTDPPPKARSQIPLRRQTSEKADGQLAGGTHPTVTHTCWERN